MYILFSPAKEMDRSQALEKDWELSSLSQEIVTYLQSLDKKDFQELLAVSDKKLDENLSYLADFEKAQSYRALDLYNGLAYRQLERSSYDEKDWEYLDRHLRILSALYGPIQPSAAIKAYRLDFNMGVSLKGQSLKSWWRPLYAKAFEQGSQLINLASQEFSSLLDKEDYEWLDIDFYQLKEDGSQNRHSTLAKKARGMMVDFMVDQRVEEPEGLQAFDRDGYSFDSDQSTQKNYVFVKK